MELLNVSQVHYALSLHELRHVNILIHVTYCVFNVFPLKFDYLDEQVGIKCVYLNGNLGLAISFGFKGVILK